MYNGNNNNEYSQGRGIGRGLGGGAARGPLGFVVKGIATGIGLASESIHAHKEKKAARKEAEAEDAHPQPQSPTSDYKSMQQEPHSSKRDVAVGEQHHELEEGDEEQWDLDDAQDQLGEHEPVNPKKRPFERDPRKIIQHFVDDYPLPESFHPHGRLTLPVVIPQRRPKTRARGFIRAYAPELMESGIDQAMFIDFIETFDSATQASPWLNAINLAGLALLPLHLAPGIGQAATIALYLTVQLMKNMQSRKRYHSVLDQLNEDFYQPRGLYCMVLTWNPETDATEVGVNINETIHQNLTPPEGIAKFTHKFTPSMGSTSGVAFSETAPLVFPALDKLDDSHSNESKTKKEQLKSAMNFTGEYFDRRAQAKFAAKHNDSQLVVGPKPTFTSRYSDPNNPTNSGDILALITAGKLSMPNRGIGGLGAGRGFGGGMGGYDRFGGRGLGGYDRFGGYYGGRGGGFGRGLGGGPLGLLGLFQGTNQRYLNQPGQTQQYPSQKSHDVPGEYKPTHTETAISLEAMSSQQYSQQMLNQGGMYEGPIGQGSNPVQMLQYGVKRILRHHVLYLLIVNMPTEEEMVEATKFMDQMREAQKQSS